MKIRDIFLLAFNTVRANKLRTGMTVSIIALGIWALVGIMTAIEAMQQKFTDSFAAMGANGFIIHFKEYQVRMGGNGDGGVGEEKKGKKKEKKSNVGKPITKEQAEDFKTRFNYPAKIGLSFPGAGDAVVSLGNKKTTPTVRIFGGDENYPELNGYTIAAGRDMSSIDVRSGRNVCIIGSDIQTKFFGTNPEKPLEKIIKINNIPYRIIGVLDSKGSTFGRSWDNTVITSYNNVRQFFNSNTKASFTIAVKVPDVKFVDAAIGESEGVFRPIRKLSVSEENNFVVDKSDSIVEMLMHNLGFMTLSAIVIGIITLVGAAVGLMNIMLVAVTERTKEIGLVKAIGGRGVNIRIQFLSESVIISLMGSIIGIVLGIIFGNLIALLMGTGFVMPYKWVVFGIVICFITGLLAGLYPAYKAARLNPIEALRYE